MNLQEAFDAGFEAVKLYVDTTLASFEERLAAVEARKPERGEKGEAGDPGKDGRDGIDGNPGRDGIDGKDGLNGKDGANGLNGKDGEPGKDGVDGKDIDPAEVEIKIGDLVRRAVSEIPVPKDGVDGAPGRDGKDADIEQIKGAIREIVKQEVALVPPAPAGRDGQPGIPGRDGKDGAPGLNGKDGFSLDDFSVESADGGRTLILLFEREGSVRKRELRTDIVIDRGIWKEGQYAKGDGVTWGGSFFIAQRDTTAKPETSQDWRLAVKRGRDGKDGKDGKPGPQGLKGDRGEPGPRGYGG